MSTSAPGAPHSGPLGAADDGVEHYDQYLDEEESPFHLLWDSSHHELDELDPFLLPDHSHADTHTHSDPVAGHVLSGGDGAPFPPGADPRTAPTQQRHTAAAAPMFTGGPEATAVSTAADVPNSTPFPRGGVAYTDMSATSSVGSAGVPSTPWVVIDEDLAESSAGGPVGASHFSRNTPLAAAQTSWACQACTFHNPMTTYTCDMCNTVDTVMQQSFSRPLLRSHQQTPGSTNGFATGRSQRLSQPISTQTKLSGSKSKPPASAAKSSKKSKR